MARTLKKVAKVTYDFATDGGAQAAITLAITESLPIGAVVTDVFAREITNVTSGGAATITVTGGGVSLTAATAIADFVTGGHRLALASSATAVRATSTANIGITIGTTTITAGKIDFYIEYLF